MLHIGKHKTGTTSFQAYVYGEKESMARLGIPMNEKAEQYNLNQRVRGVRG